MELTCKVKTNYNIGDIICFHEDSDSYSIGIINDISVEQDDSKLSLIRIYYNVIVNTYFGKTIEGPKAGTITNKELCKKVEEHKIISSVPKNKFDLMMKVYNEE